LNLIKEQLQELEDIQTLVSRMRMSRMRQMARLRAKHKGE
jgi:hypothetical protein